MAKSFSTNRSLRRFGFRQTLRGALVVAFLTGILMGAQGAAYAAAYPDQHSRDIFMKSLESVPAIGFMAGEIRDAETPASYSIYKSIALTTLIVAIWGLMTTTRLLRGQEEDGRLEAIVAGKATKTSAGVHMLIGYSYALALSFMIAWLFIGVLGLDPKVNLSFGSAGLLTLGVFLPGLFFAALGILTSQLALTRSRALAYGLVPMLAFFSVRGAANSVTDWNYLKRYTPFGWTDLLNPVLAVNAKWIIPTVIFTVIVVPLGLYCMKIRDLGGSLLPQSDVARSRYYLLGSDLGYTVRQNLWPFVWWTVGTLGYAGLLASIAKVGADALSTSPAAAKIIASLGGSYNDLVVAFLGFGGLFTALILLVMSAVTIGSIRSQEAKGYLDNLLVQPVRRTGWLAKRIAVIVVMITVISLLSSCMIWQIAKAQGVSLDLGIMLQNSFALTGTIVLLLGIGTFFYGIVPRFGAIIMYAAIIWAFVVDVLKSFFNLNDFIDKTSLLHYVSFAPTKAPDWQTFAWLAGIGIVLSLLGIAAFVRRDIITE